MSISNLIILKSTLHQTFHLVCLKQPEILSDLHSGKKSEINSHMSKDDIKKLQTRYKDYQQYMYTKIKALSLLIETMYCDFVG